MALSNKYLRYLEHLGQTVEVRELWASPSSPNMIALRHDVDHDLDMALEMAYWEHRNGIKSTYYVLPGTKYWQDPLLVEKCLQLQDFGHEVGLHLNVMTEWFRWEIDSPAQRLSELLALMRGGGVEVTGVAAHGDRMCYEQQFINYWLFSELRPENPALIETGLSAEGIRVTDAQSQIIYPEEHVITRGNGDFLPLWTVSMKELGLEYHAVHVPHEQYFSDSGGEWKRTPDPLGANLTQGRHQVLIHPEYWRGSQKLYFFLSTARSGSKWLSTVLDQASSLHSQHEFLLNHRFQQEQLVEDKRTADGFAELQDSPDQALELLLNVRPWVEEKKWDYAEVNVYLERFLPEIAKAFPDATLIHLHRSPADVVRSILNRDWYDTPEDDRHPTFPVDGWKGLGQFEKACWYTRKVNENLLERCAHRLRFQDMVADPDTLERLLGELGIAFYPRLAERFYQQRINAGIRDDFPQYANWSDGNRGTFHSICDAINTSLGYPVGNEDLKCKNKVPQTTCRTVDEARGGIVPKPKVLRRLWGLARRLWIPQSTQKNEQSLSIKLTNVTVSSGITQQIKGKELQISFEAGYNANAFILWGGGKWHSIGPKNGWKAELAHYYRGEFEAELLQTECGGSARLICLMYDPDGKLTLQRPLVRLRPGSKHYNFSFRPRSDAARFNLALYMSKGDLPDMVTVKNLDLEKLPLGYDGGAVTEVNSPNVPKCDRERR